MSSTPGVPHGHGFGGRRKKRPIVLDYLDDLDPHTPLHTKVRAMDKRRAQCGLGLLPVNKPDDTDTFGPENNRAAADPDKNRAGTDPNKNRARTDPDKNRARICPEDEHTGYPCPENLPVFVPDHESLAGLDVEAQDCRSRCRLLIREYHQLKLHMLFETAQENCRFRLYLYAVAHGLAGDWTVEPVHMRVLKRVLGLVAGNSEQSGPSQETPPTQKIPYKNAIPQNSGVARKEGQKGALTNAVVTQANGIVITSEKIDVPGRIQKHVFGS